MNEAELQVDKFQEIREKKIQTAQLVREKVNEAGMEGVPVTLQPEEAINNEELKLKPETIQDKILLRPPIPPDVEVIQTYIIMLVAALVKMEKQRKRTSYEEFISDEFATVSGF